MVAGDDKRFYSLLGVTVKNGIAVPHEFVAQLCPKRVNILDTGFNFLQIFV